MLPFVALSHRNMAVTLAQLGERTTEVQHFKPSIGFVRSLVRSRQVTVFLRLPGGCPSSPDHFELLHNLFDRFTPSSSQTHLCHARRVSRVRKQALVHASIVARAGLVSEPHPSAVAKFGAVQRSTSKCVTVNLFAGSPIQHLIDSQ